MYKLELNNYQLWTLDKDNLESWKQHPQSDCTHNIPALPPLLRRRLTPMGRNAITCLEKSLATFKGSVDALVFGSCYCESDRLHSLLCDIASREPVSPTNFSFSVHNGIISVFSIYKNFTGNIIALSSGESEVLATLLEAYILLKSGCRSVACLICDSPVPQMFRHYCHNNLDSYALAFVATAESQSEIQISLQPYTTTTSSEGHMPQALQFSDWLSGNTHNKLILGSQTGQWMLQVL